MISNHLVLRLIALLLLLFIHLLVCHLLVLFDLFYEIESFSLQVFYKVYFIL